MFHINVQIDKYAIRPTTVWYINNMPDPVQDGTSNFFDNLQDFVTLGNDILQLRGIETMQTTMRVSINSVIGLVGLIDVAASLGLPSHKNTFGNTMRRYGWENSDYFMIPILGPSTIRDTIGLVPDIYFNPTWYVLRNNVYISIGLFVIDGIDMRAKYLDTDKLLLTSLDQYATVRDFYLQSKNQTSAPKAPDVSIDDIIDGK